MSLARSSLRPASVAELGPDLRKASVRAEVSTLGLTMPDHRVVIADLGYGIDGVPGINFLRHFDIEIRFADRRILVEQIAP